MRTVFDGYVDPDLIERSLAGSALGSVWLDRPRPEYPRATTPISCDLVVVGAGYTGLWTALHAAERHPGRKIVLIDVRSTPRTELEMVRRRPPPFPPEPLAGMGIQATRWSLDRADHNAGKRNMLLRSLDALGLGFDS